MHTQTGRIYESDELARRLERSEVEPVDDDLREYKERLRQELLDHPREVFPDPDSHQAEFEAALSRGQIVPVSEQVAQQVRLGQRELKRRERRRKAAKRARKQNRT
jgi:hypothetical protein